MAYERVNWLNKGEAGAKAINKTNLNQMDKGIYDLQNVEIIAVTGTVPTECTRGEKYFNTVDNLLYTATDTNTWGTTGEEPLQGIFYIVIKDSKNYYYDGTTLISVGGGGSTDVVISEEEPTSEDWKIWIDTDEIGNLGSEVVDTLEGNETDKAPSVRAVNGTILYEDSTGTTGDITLNDSAVNYTYLEVFYVSNGTSGSTKILNPNGKNFRLNYFNNENETTLRFFHTQYTINGKNINVTEKYFNYLIHGGTLGSSTDTNYFRIHKIVGYK